MNTRSLGPFTVAEIGLGCMNLSHAYGTPPSPADGIRVIHRAIELGVTHFDTAALYGFGANESLVGEALQPYRKQVVLASKCGIGAVDGKRVIDGRPETILATCEAALRRLRTDVIDLYYLHRWDKNVPIEDSVGALAQLVQRGWIRAIGLSEVSAITLRKAHAVHPIAALQTEYSLWTRNPEIAVLETCRDLGTTFVAFSPLARGFLADAVRDPAAFNAKDIRRPMPRFVEPAFSRNVEWLQRFKAIAARLGCTPAQLALAWLLKKSAHVLPIPGTTNIAHLEENLAATAVSLSAECVSELDALINQRSVVGARYPAATQLEIDTEEF